MFGHFLSNSLLQKHIICCYFFQLNMKNVKDTLAQGLKGSFDPTR